MVLDRLKEYIDYKIINVSAFEKSIGMSNASFGKSLKNKGAIGSDKLENILIVYPDINPVWLLTGEGDMLKSDLSSKSRPYEMAIEPLILNEEQVEFKKEPIEHIMSEYERNLWDLIKSQRESITRLELSNEKLIEKVVGGKNPKEGASDVQHARVS